MGTIVLTDIVLPAVGRTPSPAGYVNVFPRQGSEKLPSRLLNGFHWWSRWKLPLLLCGMSTLICTGTGVTVTYHRKLPVTKREATAAQQVQKAP